MSREDQIRARIKAVKGVVSCNDPHQSTADFDFCQNAPGDLEYLLKKVERLEGLLADACSSVDLEECVNGDELKRWWIEYRDSRQ